LFSFVIITRWIRNFRYRATINAQMQIRDMLMVAECPTPFVRSPLRSWCMTRSKIPSWRQWDSDNRFCCHCHPNNVLDKVTRDDNRMRTLQDIQNCCENDTSLLSELGCNEIGKSGLHIGCEDG
jgi:hypothetical protein